MTVMTNNNAGPRLRIALIAIQDPFGGLGKHVRDLANELSHSHDVMVVGAVASAESLARNVHFIDFDLAAAKNNPLQCWRLWRHLRQWKPDIVHSHGNKASRILTRLRAFLPARTVGTVHWVLKKPKDRRVFQRLDAVIGVSEEVLCGIQHTDRRVIYNGIPAVQPGLSREELTARYPLDPAKPIAVAIGRMVKVKGFDVLIQAWDGLDAQLLLIGDGPEIDTYQQLARELKLDANIHFAGHIDHAANHLGAADIAVVSSLHEGFGYVIAEALISNKPVISTAVAFARKVLPERWLAMPGDRQSLHDKLASAFADLDALRDDFQPVSQWARDNLSVAAMTQKTLACYRDLLE